MSQWFVSDEIMPTLIKQGNRTRSIPRGEPFEIPDDQIPARNFKPYGPGPHRQWALTPRPTVPAEPGVVYLKSWGLRELLGAKADKMLAVDPGDMYEIHSISYKQFREDHNYIPPEKHKDGATDGFVVHEGKFLTKTEVEKSFVIMTAS